MTFTLSMAGHGNDMEDQKILDLCRQFVSELQDEGYTVTSANCNGNDLLASSEQSDESDQNLQPS